MIVVMSVRATEQEVQKVKERIVSLGYRTHLSQGTARTIIGIIGDPDEDLKESIGAMEGIEQIIRIMKPYKLSGLDFHPEPTRIRVGQHVVGGEQLTVIAGPCAVENEEQLMAAARMAKRGGASMLRGGAFKPRTSPYSFQGLGEEGLKLLAEARKETGLPVVTELLDPHHLELLDQYADVFQIGARNMQNYTLLREVGKASKPVLLKRGLNATYKELLMAAEYILEGGNEEVMLCERGIRTFEDYTRNTLDISAVPVIKELSHLPIIVDPSHSGGRWPLVNPLSKAAVAAGADGLLVEIHPQPDHALCDGPQSLKEDNFTQLMKELGAVAGSVGRKL